MEPTHDFYFSEKHKINKATYNKYYTSYPYEPRYFKGKEYTEMVSKGKTPLSEHFGDLVLLGEGIINDVS